MHLGSRQIAAFDDPRRALADLSCHQRAGADHAKDCHLAGLQHLGRLLKCELAALLALALSVDGDVMAFPETIARWPRSMYVPCRCGRPVD
jgi:hypothetical protein